MKIHLIFSITVISIMTFGQELKTKDVNLEKLMDEIFPVQDEDFNYEELYEMYGQLLANPVNLNIATEEQLRSLLILNSTQLSEFLKYRKENAPLLSVYELQTIPSFHENTIRLLEPFVLVEGNTTTGWKGLANRIIHEENNYFVTRLERTLETRAGFQEESPASVQYGGSPIKSYNRFRVSSLNDFSMGFTAEKDAGEKMKWNPSTKTFGFDFLSSHAQFSNKGNIKNLIVGDYQSQFGQGLTLGGGFGMGKGPETIAAIRRSNLGFIPYTSVAEFGFFRGAATSIAINKFFTVHGFYSRLLRDARIVSESNDGAPESVSSLFLSGLHRTAGEEANKKNFSEMNWGGVIQYKDEKFDGGFIIHQTIFSVPINRSPAPYNQFGFNGDNNANLGCYWNYSFSNFSFFSEASHTLGGGSALVSGLLASISHTFDLSILYRNYARDFHTFYSNAIAESSVPQNESGIYWGLKYRVSKKQFASGYIDLFRFPWLRFRSYRPSEGSEWMFRYTYQPSKTTLIFVQARQEEKNRNIDINAPRYANAQGIKTNYWLSSDYRVSSQLDFKTKAQFVTYRLNQHTTRGFTLVQDVNFTWKKVSLSTRFALFHTDDYDTRLYIYERDAWLSFSIPALQGIGTRKYVLIQYKISPNADLWLRWAATEYENQDTIGTGSELINGNIRNDFKLQFRIKF